MHVRFLAALAVIALAACWSGGTSRSDQGRSIASEAGLPSEVGEVFSLALEGTKATYTLTYSTTDKSGASVQISVAQRPPDRRVDVFGADGTIESTFRVGTTAYQCTKTTSWACGTLTSKDASASPSDPLNADAVAAAVDKFRQRASDYDFRVDRRTVAGTDARCLVTTRKAGHDQDPSLGTSATMCVSPEGAVLSVEVPTGAYAATGYSTMVSADAFSLPAPADQAPSASS